MTKEETLRLLQFLKGCYPNVKIDDPVGMVAAWEMQFGEQDAELVYKAARCHIARSPYFPNPSDIIDNYARARILFEEVATDPRIEDGKKVKELPAGKEETEQMSDDELLEWIFGPIQ